MKRNQTVRRRATVLIMVVTLLALLFVIVSGYLTLARFDRQSLIIAQQGNTADEIVDGVNNLVLSLVREQWLDDSGEVLGGPDVDPEQWTYEDAYSYGDRDTYWIAAADPVFDPTAPVIPGSPYPELEQVRWPAVSSFAPVDRPIQSSIRALMLKQNDSALNTVEPLTAADIKRNARLGFMDAVGDGVPGAGLLASAAATELANTMSGTSVRLRGMQLHNVYGASAIPAEGHTGPVDDLWRRYDNLARFEVAVRVVPHGGMLSLGLPNRTASDQWNHVFAQRMFTWLGRGKQGVGSPPDSQFLGQLYAEAAAVEPALRRRGGLLPSYRPQGEDARVPDLLRRLEKDNWGIFAPTVNGEVPWQRFNLGTIDQSGNANEWALWRDRAFLNATRVKTYDVTALRDYDRRHLITTVSHSDELARKQEGFRYGVVGAVGTHQGQTKFYLGDVEKCFRRAGEPNPGTFDPVRAAPIIKRLAGVFYDMLAGHDFTSEQYDRDDQAYMLAVNTVAFAAPRDPATGFIDVVAYATTGKSSKTYVGYAPQPFITQVIAYDNDPDQHDDDIALAVELYNPHEALDPLNQSDPYALDLSQFAVSMENGDPKNPVTLKRLDAVFGAGLTRLPGRRFVKFVVNHPSNHWFEDRYAQMPGGVAVIDDPNFPTDPDGNGNVTVKLWRGGSNNNWYVVDQLFLQEPFDSSGDGSGGASPAPKKTWVLDVYRDTSTELYFGGPNANYPARWGVVLDITGSDSEVGEDVQPSGWRHVGASGPSLATRITPTVPLSTINANTAGMQTGITSIHGANRPNSFPTVGFLLFVPRFSHTTGSGTNAGPVTKVLTSAWLKQSSTEGFGVTNYPADFGHMPIFDNKQNEKSGEYFDDDVAGPIPWGLLVFDYFTTLDPDGLDGVPNTTDDIDPYRVPGRINVNAAPWFVLAGLPVVSPYSSPFSPSDLDGDGALDLPLHVSASPAFRLTGSGILAGLGVGLDGLPDTPDDVPRSLVYWTSANPTPLTYDGWWHLGTDLALAAAEYRDRVPRIAHNNPNVNFPYRGGSWRNETKGINAPPAYRDSPRYGDIRRGRGVPGDPRKYGLLSLGELANVKGFNSATYDPVTGDGDGGGPAYLDPLAPASSLDPVAGDFMRAVSLLALLDTHFLTTRSNTFTAYVTVTDRQDPQQSVRSQITIDRSNILPRLLLDVNDVDLDGDREEPIIEDPDGAGLQPRQAVVITKDGLPEVIAERRVGYYNARFDD